MARKGLLVCGTLSSLLYVGTDILGAMRYEGYGYTSQTISELAAIGAPSDYRNVVSSLRYNLGITGNGQGPSSVHSQVERFWTPWWIKT